MAEDKKLVLKTAYEHARRMRYMYQEKTYTSITRLALVIGSVVLAVLFAILLGFGKW